MLNILGASPTTWQDVVMYIGGGLIFFLIIFGGDIIDHFRSRSSGKPSRKQIDKAVAAALKKQRDDAEAQPDKFCTSCGASRKGGALHCPKCGTKLAA